MIDPEVFKSAVGAPLSNREHIRYGLSHLVNTQPSASQLVEISDDQRVLYLVGEDYVARVDDSASTAIIETRRLSEVTRVDLSLTNDAAVSQLSAHPSESTFDALSGTILSVCWEDQAPWTLGGPDWTSASRRQDIDPKERLAFLWALLRRLEGTPGSIGWRS